jgi:hypothetical protein
MKTDKQSFYWDHHKYSGGIGFVIVNGTLGNDQGEYTNQLSGRVLLHGSQLK